MTVSPPVRLVVVGAGLIGPRHAQHIVANSSTELVALVDPAPKAAQVADLLHTLHFSSIDALFAHLDAHGQPYPDGALVCTPNSTHAAVASSLAAKGVHLLVEKPVSSSLDEALELRETVRRTGTRVLVGHHRRFNPFIVAAKQHLPAVGRVIAVQGTWTLRKPEAYFDQGPWRRSSALGGGALLINLVHDLDLLQYLLGPVERVYAELVAKERPTDADEGACLTLRFRSGVSGTFICADNVTSPFNFEVGTGENPAIPADDMLEGFYKVFGTKGTLLVPDLTLYHQPELAENTWTQPLTRTALVDDRRAVRAVMPFENQLNHFVDVVQGKAAPACTIDDGISALLCVEAVVRSLETGLPQTIEHPYETAVPEPKKMVQ